LNSSTKKIMPSPIISKGYTLFTGEMAQKGYLSVIDQSVVSGSNFLTGVLLGRLVAPAEYGVFVIAWTTLMIALSLQNALVCTPMSVIGAQKQEADCPSYWGSLLIVQTVLSGGTCLFIAIAGIILHGVSGLSFSSPSFPSLIAATVISCFFLQGQEFFRRLLIVKLSLKETLINDLVTNTIRIGGLLILVYTGSLSTITSLYVIGFSLVAGASLGYLRLRNDIRISYERLQSDFLESWHFGKWVMAEMLPYVLSVQGYTYLTAIIIGAQQTAALGASQNLLNATNILILSFTNVVTPIASRKYSNGGSRALGNFMIKAGILSAVPILGFYLLTMLFAKEILILVYKQNYAGYGALLIICSIYYMVSYFNRFLQIILYARKKPNIGFLAKSISLVVMVVFAYPLIKQYGVYGAAIGTVISQVVILGGILLYLTRRLKGNHVNMKKLTE
jgi:O-antigen/teichoic acid export membrane protein